MNSELIDYLLKCFEEKLNNHDRRLDLLENRQAEINVRLENLCNNIEGLTNSIKWLTTIAITTLLGFFIWVIQNSIFKF